MKVNIDNGIDLSSFWSNDSLKITLHLKYLFGIIIIIIIIIAVISIASRLTKMFTLKPHK